ncbi:MAG: phosphodiester glycosidase family protein [Deltaproteobacteria bacterium]
MSRMQKLQMEKEYKKTKIKKVLQKYILYPFIFILFFSVTSILIIFHSPFTDLKELYVTTAMTTMTQQYLARIFVSDEEINRIMEKNKIDDSSAKSNNGINTSGYNDKIELIPMQRNSFKGFLMIIHDPSRVSVGTTSKLGSRGMKVLDIVSKYNAIAGINAGGFSDEGGHGNGGTPEGIIIENYKIMYKQGLKTYSVIGFDSKNTLVLGKYSLKEIEKLNLRDAVSFKPFLIVNGESMIKSGNGGWGLGPRTIIGQRKDGAVLFLVVDGRQITSIGATLKDCVDIMLENGAYNAANLDGGASTTLVYENKIQNNPCSRYGPRFVPSAFLVK